MKISFENFKFNPFQCKIAIFLDPAFNIYYENNLQNLNTKYYTVEEAYKHLYQIKTKHFSILNLNIRSLNKHFDNLISLLNSLSFDFKIICLTETYCKDIIVPGIFPLFSLYEDVTSVDCVTSVKTAVCYHR